jgi:hypothetical protein
MESPEPKWKDAWCSKEVTLPIELDRVTLVPETPVVKINQPREDGTTRLASHLSASAHAVHCICIIVIKLRWIVLGRQLEVSDPPSYKNVNPCWMA